MLQQLKLESQAAGIQLKIGSIHIDDGCPANPWSDHPLSRGNLIRFDFTTFKHPSVIPQVQLLFFLSNEDLSIERSKLILRSAAVDRAM